METATTSVPQDQIRPVPVVDVRTTPLEQLASDAEAHRMVIKVMESMEGQSRVRVAMFDSAI